MAAFWHKFCKQKAVLYKFNGVGSTGQPEFDPGVEVDVRWDNTSQKFMDAQGAERISTAMVLIVQGGCKGGDFLYLGTLEGSPSHLQVLRDRRCKEVKRMDENPDIQNRETVYLAYL
jgi:hypothetical protein